VVALKEEEAFSRQRERGRQWGGRGSTWYVRERERVESRGQQDAED
jgi:hypothetical protein